jgi:hypothetical protein
MRLKLVLLLALTTFTLPGSSQQRNHPLQNTHKLVHFVMINMSGSPRELHHRGDTVPLPVATRVPLQVPEGDTIEITSTTDTRTQTTLTVTTSDEGHLLPIR